MGTEQTKNKKTKKQNKCIMEMYRKRKFSSVPRFIELIQSGYSSPAVIETSFRKIKEKLYTGLR